MTSSTNYPWLKSKGYLHLTPQLNVVINKEAIVGKVMSPLYVSKYGFFPLVHSSIKERKYKKAERTAHQRSHTYLKNEETISNAKERPLHYSCNMDSLIFGYYSHVLLEKYNNRLSQIPELNAAVIAYRKIPIDDNSEKNKSTIHFAKEVFDEIIKRSVPECVVLKYDIKSFFNRMDHGLLLSAWKDILGLSKLDPDHYNVYKNCVDFSYILKDDLRPSYGHSHGRRPHFDEKKLSHNRKAFGVKSFYSSIEEFRNSIAKGELKIYKHPFRSKETKKPVGIPQGLPISSILANLYLLDFDLKIIQNLVLNEKYKCFYRRYSDDIVLICESKDNDFVNDFIDKNIRQSKVEMSHNKTEKFLFKYGVSCNGASRLSSIKVENSIEKIHPFTYLGLEFYGYKTLVKSSNLAKFYRRMIFAVKRKAKRAISLSEGDPSITPALFLNQLTKLYTQQNLSLTHIRTHISYLRLNQRGEYYLKTKKINRKFNSNYLTYINRVNNIVGGELINRQLRNHKKILRQALNKHFYNKIKNV